MRNETEIAKDKEETKKERDEALHLVGTQLLLQRLHLTLEVLDVAAVLMLQGFVSEDVKRDETKNDETKM